jgi:hypothetical protein
VPYSVPDEKIINLIREGKVITIHREEITKLSGNQIHLSNGTTLDTDMLVLATGWKTIYPIFSEEDSLALGLPVKIDRLPSLAPSMEYPSQAYQKATDRVLQLFPRLAKPPVQPREPTYTQNRLYRFIVPLPFVKLDDRSLVIVGRLAGVGTSVINDVSALWAVAWMTGKIKVTQSMEEIESEVDLYNAYVRRRYFDGGRHAILFIYEWISVSNLVLDSSSSYFQVLLTLELPDGQYNAGRSQHPAS